MESTEKMISVGIDLHTTQFTVCALGPYGEILNENVYPTEERGYAEFIAWAHKAEEEYEAEVQMAVEATGNARYFRNLMQHEGFNVLVINTMKFKVIVTSAKKTDKHDAFTIALFLLKDMIPESYLCDQDTEELRKLLSERSALVSTIVSTKNKVHALLRGYGMKTTGSQFQSEKKRQQLLTDLKSNGLCTERAAKTLNVLLQTITALDMQVKETEKLIYEFTCDDEDVEILKSIPGVGNITAATIKAYAGDVRRFDSFKQFSAYCGLVPYVKFSNESGYTGHITKRGPKELRTAMVQVVMGMLRCQSKLDRMVLIQMYKKMKQEKGSGISIVAFARKLSRIIYVMLTTGTPFDLEKLCGGGYDVAS